MQRGICSTKTYIVSKIIQNTLNHREILLILESYDIEKTIVTMKINFKLPVRHSSRKSKGWNCHLQFMTFKLCLRSKN